MYYWLIISSYPLFPRTLLHQYVLSPIFALAPHTGLAPFGETLGSEQPRFGERVLFPEVDLHVESERTLRFVLAFLQQDILYLFNFLLLFL